MTGWAEYQKDKDEREAAESTRVAQAKARGKALPSANAKRGGSPAKDEAKALRRVGSLEKRVEKAEKAMAKFEDELGRPGEVVDARESGKGHIQT